MKLPLDPGDVIGDGLWEAIKRMFTVFSTIWGGVIMALVAFYISQALGAVWSGAWGKLVHIMLDAGETILWSFLLAPFYLFMSFSGFILIPLMSYIMFAVFRMDHDVTWVWYTAVLVVGVVALAGILAGHSALSEALTAWTVYVLQMISLSVGCWFLVSWRKNSQVQHLLDVYAENEHRKVEIADKYGTKSFGQDNHERYRE